MKQPINTSGIDTDVLTRAVSMRKRTQSVKPVRQVLTGKPARKTKVPAMRPPRAVPTLVARKQAALRQHGRSADDPNRGTLNLDPTHKPADLSQPSRFHIAITTYNRPEQLAVLLRQIQQFKGPHEVQVYVYDDASPKPLSPEALGSAKYVRFEQNGGKAMFWRSVNRALADAQARDFDYFVMLQDDLELVPDFFNLLRWNWENLPDRNKAALNIRLDRERTGKACWTNYKPRIRRFGRLRVWQTQWTDCCFAGSRELIRLLPNIEPISPKRVRQMTSSGVGRQISLRLHNMGRTVWQVASTLTHHGKHASVMHPELRKKQPLTA